MSEEAGARRRGAGPAADPRSPAAADAAAAGGAGAGSGGGGDGDDSWDGDTSGKEPAAAAFSLLLRWARGRWRPCPPRAVPSRRPCQGRDEGLTPDAPLGGPGSRQGVRAEAAAGPERAQPGEMRVFSSPAPRRGRLVPTGVMGCRLGWLTGREAEMWCHCFPGAGVSS